MCSAIVNIIALLAFVGSRQVQGFVIKDGNCSLVSANVPFVKNFEVEKYLGKWYELERYEQNYERNLECVTTEFRSTQPVGMLEVKNRGYLPKNETFQTFSGIGMFREQSLENETIAKLNISLGPTLNSTDYWIVSTDYVNYSIVYSCMSFLEADQSVEGYWLLSRSQKLPDNAEVIERVKYLRSTYFDTAHMRVTNQTEELCPAEEGLPPAPSSIILPPLTANATIDSPVNAPVNANSR